jgi:hypothetical protein
MVYRSDIRTRENAIMTWVAVLGAAAATALVLFIAIPYIGSKQAVQPNEGLVGIGGPEDTLVTNLGVIISAADPVALAQRETLLIDIPILRVTNERAFVVGTEEGSVLVVLDASVPDVPDLAIGNSVMVEGSVRTTASLDENVRAELTGELEDRMIYIRASDVSVIGAQ